MTKIDLEELSKEKLIEKLERCREALENAGANTSWSFHGKAIGHDIAECLKEVFGEGVEAENGE